MKADLRVAMEWCNRWFEEGALGHNYESSVIKCMAYPKRTAKSNGYQMMLNDDEQENLVRWGGMMAQLVEWKRLRRSIIVEVTVATVARKQRTPPPPPPQSTQRTRVTATQRQLERFDSNVQDLEREGNFATSLTLQ